MHHLSFDKTVLSSGYVRFKWYRRKIPAMNQITATPTILLDKNHLLLFLMRVKFFYIQAHQDTAHPKEKLSMFY